MDEQDLSKRSAIAGSDTVPAPAGSPLLLRVLAWIGIPATPALGVAVGWVTHNPVLGVLTSILTSLLTWARPHADRILGRVAERINLENRIIDLLVDRAERLIRAFSFGIRKRYVEHLGYLHRDFDVKGLSAQGPHTLRLAKVFVDLAIAPTPADQASANPLRAVSGDPQPDRFPLWSWLTAPEFADRPLVLIGPPGSGKTTLLKHAVLVLAGTRRERRRYQAPSALPILLILRDLAAAVKSNPDYTLVQAVRDDLKRTGGPEVAEAWLANYLGRGGCLVLFDGLDEVADARERRAVVAWVQRQMRTCRRNRFVITSRPYGYRENSLDGVTVLEVQPFTREQVAAFVRGWYLANEIMSALGDDPGVRLKARREADDLLDRLNATPNIAALAVNPLLLTLIATVHRFRSSLPGRRVELYKEICDVFLGRRRQAMGIEADLTPAKKQEVLQPLAYHLMDQRKREIAVDEAERVIAGALASVSREADTRAFLKSVEESSGLLLERERGIYGFAHLTFQEYLAAAYGYRRRQWGLWRGGLPIAGGMRRSACTQPRGMRAE